MSNPALPITPWHEESADLALAHLADEERLLESAVTILNETRTALLAGDLPTLKQALERQAALEQAGSRLRERRDRMRARIASYCGVATEAATLDLLARDLPEHRRTALHGSRERLRRLAGTAGDLGRGNALLLKSCLDLFDQLLSGITGGGSSGKRYGPGGDYQSFGYGSLLSARG